MKERFSDYGVSELERGHWVYAGPRWLEWLTRFAFGRCWLRRYYRLWFIGEIQQDLNIRLSNYVDSLELGK